MTRVVEGFERYLTHLAHERRLAPLTLKHYRRDLDALSTLAGDEDIHALTQQHIRRFVAQLYSGGLGARSLARLLSAWRGYFRFAIAMKMVTHNPASGLRPPKAGRMLPRALSPDEAAQLLSSNEDSVWAQRDHAMFELLYSSGLRLSELTSLNLPAVDFAAAEVRVVGKGLKTRIIPVGRAALNALKNWLAVRADILRADPDAIFIGPRGARLSPRAIQYRIKQWAVRHGIDTNVHPHILRHSFASHVLQSSGDLRAVQEMLGHASISSTQIYAHLDFQHLAKIYDAAHPRAKKKSPA